MSQASARRPFGSRHRNTKEGIMKVFEIQPGSSSLEGVRPGTRDTPKAGPREVLVRMRAASLNYRDLAVATGHYFGGPATRKMVPLSDGAGEIEAVGDGVTGFAVGDRVVGAFSSGHPPAPLGSPQDGVLTEYRVFPEDGVVKFPPHLSFEEASTLPCAGVTAWNALMESKVLVPGETVLCLGTGGVSVWALQIAKVAGARVIITSSSDDKLKRARELGADDVINYKTTPEWHKEVMKLTGGEGADHIVEVGGVGTLPLSYQSVGRGGEIGLIGVLTQPQGDLSPHPMMLKGASLRGIFVGPTEYLVRLCRAVGVNKIHPVIDSVFAFDEAPDAYKYLQSAKHFGKVVIKI
jgi:NADPH:quinone reductase-like Zn-dependent oxidoreductase